MSNYLYVLDTIVCYPPTFQNLAPLNLDKHTPPWSSDHNSQSGSLGDDICVYRICMFCTVGGQHRCTFFCVEWEGFHANLAPPHSDCTVCNLKQASSAECSSWMGWQEHHSLNFHLLRGSSSFGLVVFKVLSSGAVPNAAGILFYACWSTLLHTVQLRVGFFCRVLLLSGTIETSSSNELGSVEELSVASLVVSGVSSSRVSPCIIGIPDSTDWFSLSVSLSDGGIGFWKGCKSFIWHGTSLTSTEWWLTTPVTHPSLNLVVHWLPGDFI